MEPVTRPETNSQKEAREHRIEEFEELMAPVIRRHHPLITGELLGIGFFDAPASTKHHGAYPGGLFDHSANVTRVLVNLTKDCDLKWEREESPLIIGMFHDICKSDQYRHPVSDAIIHSHEGDILFTDESRWEYNPDCVLKGHGDKSVMMLSKYFTLTSEEILCIRYHMGAFVDQKEWNDYTRAIHVCPNVLWTHHADMIAAHIWEVKA